MKKISCLLLFAVFISQISVYAAKIETVKEPVWEEYVAPKFQNPTVEADDGSRAKELVWGIILTRLVLTAPVGIPMIVHSSTRMKMDKMAKRKEFFEKEIEKARLIKDDNKRKEEYERILRECRLKESTRLHYIEKRAKKENKEKEKLDKKIAKQLKKQKRYQETTD